MVGADLQIPASGEEKIAMNSLSEHLGKLTPIQRGAPMQSVITTDRINAIQSSILAIAGGHNIETAGGATKTTRPGSVLLSAPESTREFTPPLEPFEVYISGTPDSFRAGYSPGVYILCHLGYVTTMINGSRLRPVASIYNSVTYAYDDIQDEDYGWFISHSYGASDKYVWLEVVTDRTGAFVTSPTYQYSHYSPSIWFTDSSSPPEPIGLHGYESHQYRYILIARVVADSSEPSGFKIYQYQKGNIRIESNRDINNRRYENRHPFELYETEADNGALPVYYMAWGTVCRGDEKQSAFTISAGATGKTLDTTIDFTGYPFLYLKCTFLSTGEITYLTLEQLATKKDSCYEYVSTTSNIWWHPIGHYRTARFSKSANSALPDSGEENQPPDSLYTMAQLTNTHLVGQQQCITDYSGTTRTGWKLVPGPGATFGTNS